MSFIAALKTEIANLEAELERSLPYIRLQEVRRTLALYESDEPPAAKRPSLGATLAMLAGKSEASLAASERIVSPFTARRGSPERAKALEAARLFLANRTGEPTPTAAIYDHIVGLGIEIGGSDPRNNLSAMLSNSDIFLSHGRSGWTLTSPVTKFFDDDDGSDDDFLNLRRGRELEARGYDAPPPPPPKSDEE